jgi:hypothetical protein
MEIIHGTFQFYIQIPVRKYELTPNYIEINSWDAAIKSLILLEKKK